MQEERPSAYWYAGDSLGDPRVRLLEALRMYRAAETAMRRRTQQSMSMGENELLALRYITRARSLDRLVTPMDLARYLGISTASVTALLDRLEKTDHVVRAPHPTDRRKIVLSTTGHTDEEIRATLGEMHARMYDAVDGIPEDDARTIIDFLERMRTAVDAVDA